MKEKQLIYSLEDDKNISDLLKYALEDAGYKVVCFDSTKNLLASMKKSIPNIVILDIMLDCDESDGMDVLVTIRKEYENVDIKIIMVTAKATEMNKVHAFNLGADDYITKPFSILELVARVKANLRKRSVCVDENILGYGKIKLEIESRNVYVSGKSIELTYKEFELLKLLILKSGSVVDREKMLNSVWGYDAVIETRTIDMHIKSLRQKLGLAKNLITTVRGVGYRLGK